MSTTNLFVELIVVGLGSFAWIALLILAALGLNISAVEAALTNAALALPALALVYLLGIVTDRLADRLFHFTMGHKDQIDNYPGGAESFYADRALMLTKSEPCAQLYEYGRTRQRICRGWAFNSIALLVSVNFFIWARHSELPPNRWGVISLVVSVALAALAAACWMTWKALADTELKRVHEQASVLRSGS